jgi:hypothetical protein
MVCERYPPANCYYGVTVNVAELADPPAVVTVNFPVFAPAGTVTLNELSDFIVNGAATLPNVTFVVCVSPVPVIMTAVPTRPLLGDMVVIVGMTLNCWLMLVKLPAGLTTVTVPVLAPTGTLAVRYVSDETV